MKNIFLVLLLAIGFMSCENEEMDLGTTDTEATILGRWQLEGLESIRYEFTSTKRFDIYANDDGSFPTLEEFTAINPNLTGLDWVYDGDAIVVDLNFGNESRFVPKFKCNNEVVDLILEDGSSVGTYYREGHDFSACR